MITLLATTTDNSAAQAGHGLFAILVMFGIYMLPTLIALFRRKAEGGVSILLVNFLLGWTVVGWILCLVWANTGRTIRDIRREEQWHKQLLNAVNGKVNLLAAIVLAALAVTAQAYAMGLGVLRQQAHQRVDIEFAVTDFGAVCSGDTSAECKDKRNKIAADINSYIAGIEGNINFCKRYAEKADPSERPEIEKSIRDYEKDIQWAQSQLKAVSPAAVAALPTSAAPSKSPVANVNRSPTAEETFSASGTTNDNELMDWDMDQATAERAAEMANAVPQKPLTGKLSAIKLFLDLPQAYWEAESPHVNAKGYDELVAAGISVPTPETFEYRQGKYLIAVWFDKKSGLAREVSIAPENLDEDLTLSEAKQIVASVGITKPPVKDRETAGWLNWNKQGKVSASFTDEHELFITVEKGETQTAIAPSSATTRQRNADQQGLTHWLTLSSNKRHNSSCRYYQNSHGRPCRADEGIPCKICGG